MATIYANQPAILLFHINESATIRTSQPNRLKKHGRAKLTRVRFGSPNLCSPVRRHQHHARDPNSACLKQQVAGRFTSVKHVPVVTRDLQFWKYPGAMGATASTEFLSFRQVRFGVTLAASQRKLPCSAARHVCCEGVQSGGHDTKAGAPPYLGQIVRPPSCSGIHGGAGSRAGTTDTAGGGENGSG